jgi:hypothetical protein
MSPFQSQRKLPVCRMVKGDANALQQHTAHRSRTLLGQDLHRTRRGMARTRTQHIFGQLWRGILWAGVDDAPLCPQRIGILWGVGACDERNGNSCISKGKSHRGPSDACADDQHIAFQIFRLFGHDQLPCLRCSVAASSSHGGWRSDTRRRQQFKGDKNGRPGRTPANPDPSIFKNNLCPIP